MEQLFLVCLKKIWSNFGPVKQQVFTKGMTHFWTNVVGCNVIGLEFGQFESRLSQTLIPTPTVFLNAYILKSGPKVCHPRSQGVNKL